MSDQSSKIGITCAVCTYNSPHTLPETLESLIEQQIEDDGFEILVIDNGGFEKTAEVAKVYQERSAFAFRIISEEKPGLSNARNRALKEARFPFVAYIDDDAIASRKWAKLLLKSFENKEVWASGGPVKPKWVCDRPYWLNDSLLRSLSVVEWGDEDRWLKWPERIIGTNMSFRVRELLELGGFDPNLGRVQGNMGGMEDTVIQKEMANEGRFVFYVAEADVAHLVPSERCRMGYFCRRAFGHTQSELRTGGHPLKGIKRELCQHAKGFGWFALCFLKCFLTRKPTWIDHAMSATKEFAIVHWIITGKASK